MMTTRNALLALYPALSGLSDTELDALLKHPNDAPLLARIKTHLNGG